MLTNKEKLLMAFDKALNESECSFNIILAGEHISVYVKECDIFIRVQKIKDEYTISFDSIVENLNHSEFDSLYKKTQDKYLILSEKEHQINLEYSMKKLDNFVLPEIK